MRATHASDVLTLALGLLVGSLIGAIPGAPIRSQDHVRGRCSAHDGHRIWLDQNTASGVRRPDFRRRSKSDGGDGPERLHFGAGDQSGLAVYQVASSGPVWELLIACQFVSLVPELVAWWIGRHVLNLNPALLMGAIAGARQNTTSMRAAQKESQSAVPGIGYPVPLAIATIVVSVVGYFFALFA